MASDFPPSSLDSSPNTILGDAQELSPTEEMGDHHNARNDDNLRYFRVFGLQHSNKTDGEEIRCFSRSHGVSCQFVRPGLRFWPHYLRTPV